MSEEARPPQLELLVDTRERALLAELTRRQSSQSVCKFECRSEMLDIGDVHVRLVGGASPVLAILVERKTLGDLAASIRDGRYHEQKERSAASGAVRVLYVIEASPGALQLGDGPMPDVYGMPAARVQGCITSLLLSERVKVVITRSVEETAGLLVRLGAALLRRAESDASGHAHAHAHAHADAHAHAHAHADARYERSACTASAVRVRKRDNVDPRLCYLQQLCQVPGVSHGIATSIASAYPTMRALLSSLEGLPDDRAREAQLSKVPMVGRKLSARLCEYMMFAAPS